MKAIKSTNSSAKSNKDVFTKAQKADAKVFRNKRQTARGRGWVALQD